MNKTIATLAAIGTFVIPAASFAAMYDYVATDKTVKSVDAVSPQAALATPGIDVHSGVILASSLDGSTDTSAPSMTSPTTIVAAANKASDLQVAMHDLLTEHVAASLDVLRDISDGDSDAMKGALAEQDENAVDLSNAIGSVYGTDAGTAFLTIFRAHIKDSNAYTQAIKDGSMTDKTAALAALDAQLVKLTDLLSGANPNIDNATLLAALRQHEDLINKSSEAYAAGNYDQAFDLERQAITQIAGGADYLSGAIVKQYPNMFPGSTTTGAAKLRAAMHDLLTEHVAASATVLRDINDARSSKSGALAEQDANAVDLAAAIGSVYGTDAQAAFLKIFRAHIVASNDYTQAIKDGSMTDKTAALKELDNQLVQITNLLSGANPNIDNATLLAALRQHEDLLNKSSEAYAAGDVTSSYDYLRKALTQIAGGADYLSNAIVTQYPSKF